MTLWEGRRLEKEGVIETGEIVVRFCLGHIIVVGDIDNVFAF